MKNTSTSHLLVAFSCLIAVLAAMAFSGCSTPAGAKQVASGTNAPAAESVKLREGDTIYIHFPGAPTLNVKEVIKRDGKISLLVGEVVAAGKTIPELQKELLELYSPQLVTKSVVVSLETSTFPVYVSGAVARNGKMMVDRPMTALEAIMEAGVDLTRANLKGVRVTRIADGTTSVHSLNLDRWLKGKPRNEEPFYVKPSDIIYVPQKFQWF